ncbi:MAG: calcium/proton exchanger [Chloroflexi bacterium RBG_13_54_8]|nr:MAG: calcium/proton exchanger [Chloroflexi bacterium RBG_13_54_8]
MQRSWRELHFTDILLVFIPISAALYYLHVSNASAFVTTALAIVALTHRMVSSTAIIAAQVSNTVSALLNVTFGNAVEFFIAIFALRSGLVEMVKASMVGSITISVLLLIGLAMMSGGLKYKEQRFNKDSAGLSSTMLIIVVIGLAMPSLYSMIEGQPRQSMSQAVSVILGAIYILGLVYMLVTHTHLFMVERHPPHAIEVRKSTRAQVAILLISTLLLTFECHILVGTVEPLIRQTGLTETFIGLVVIALITNIPEHLSAITFARQDNMTLSLEIGMNSATQIALFVVPVLVLLSPTFMEDSLNLVFTPLQLAALMITGIIANFISSDGVCHWLEGAQLIAVYLIIATAFYFL